MTIDTKSGFELEPTLLSNYFDQLINRFFKILPIRESEEKSLPVYVERLQRELFGCKELIPAMCTDDLYLTLLSVLQFLIDHPDCPVRDVRREVFGAINICNKLKSQYSEVDS